MLRIFLGFDRRETVAFHVASQSIHRHASCPVSIAPLCLSQLGGDFQRSRDPLQSTDFSFSRFLVPHLCGYEGWALYADCDILVREDIATLWAMRDEQFAVQVVKHDHVPRESRKFLGEPQTAYARKNWSSLMLFNNARCRALTRSYVETAGGLDLHQFRWLPDDGLIGVLPKRWNHLVGYEADGAEEAAVLHFTLGGPWLDEHGRGAPADAWRRELEIMLDPMGQARRRLQHDAA